MPSLPHLVYGKVYLSGTNQIVEGVAVTVTDTTLNEGITNTTNASGEYSVNLANLTGTWNSGDGLSITASKSNRSKTETTTILGGSNHVDLTLDIAIYPDFNLDTEQSLGYSALDIMDYDKTFTYNSAGRIIKEVGTYGKFTITKYFKYDSTSRITNENKVVE